MIFLKATAKQSMAIQSLVAKRGASVVWLCYIHTACTFILRLSVSLTLLLPKFHVLRYEMKSVQRSLRFALIFSHIF